MVEQVDPLSHVLATDLDGTLIPLDGSAQNRDDLRTLTRELNRRQVSLVFVTGRHLRSVANAIDSYQLPRPSWLVCDVGTTIYEQANSGEFLVVDRYHRHLSQIVAALPIQDLRGRLQAIDGLTLQESAKQGVFKLSYYVDADRLPERVAAVEQMLARTDAPYTLISSIDPFTDDGLIDVLPRQVSKAYALAWWVEYAGVPPDSLVFAGDSGNDVAALTAGYRAIVVANARRDVAQAVQQAHAQAGWHDRLFLATRTATSGVLDGCRQFGII